MTTSRFSVVFGLLILSGCRPGHSLHVQVQSPDRIVFFTTAEDGEQVAPCIHEVTIYRRSEVESGKSIWKVSEPNAPIRGCYSSIRTDVPPRNFITSAKFAALPPGQYYGQASIGDVAIGGADFEVK